MAKKQVYQKVTIAQAVRDVLIASMNKGLFPLAVLALIVIVAIVKMPSEDVSTLVFQVVQGLTARALIGWFLSGGIAIFWLLHSKWQRRIINAEMARLSDLRNQLQEKLLGGKLPSSE